jgi:hypothetical protein
MPFYKGEETLVKGSNSHLPFFFLVVVGVELGPCTC